jgi:hypothetical protein
METFEQWFDRQLSYHSDSSEEVTVVRSWAWLAEAAWRAAHENYPNQELALAESAIKDAGFELVGDPEGPLEWAKWKLVRKPGAAP